MKRRYEVDVTRITTYVVECDEEGDALEEYMEGRIVGPQDGVEETVDMQVTDITDRRAA